MMWKVLLFCAVLVCSSVAQDEVAPVADAPELTFNEDTTSCLDDPNAYIGCAGRCHRTCDDYQLANKTFLCPHICIKACDCKPGFVYEKTSKRCIDSKDCPKKEAAPSDPDPAPVDDEVAPVNNPPAPEPTFKEDTTSCLNDPNAYIGCAGRCHRTCDDYQLADKTYLCPHICIKACDCKPGFVYEKTSKRCIPSKDCPKKDTAPSKPNPKPKQCKAKK